MGQANVVSSMEGSVMLFFSLTDSHYALYDNSLQKKAILLLPCKQICINLAVAVIGIIAGFCLGIPCRIWCDW